MKPMKIFKAAVTVILTVTAPIWIIPAFLLVIFVDSVKELHEQLWD